MAGDDPGPYRNFAQLEKMTWIISHFLTGGRVKAIQLFGAQFQQVIQELSEVLAG